jgi:hypothetical protein
MSLDELWEVPGERPEIALPVFSGTYDEHVNAWLKAYASAQRHQWELAAIAVSLERSVGGSPRHQAARQQTLIQRFCGDVRIDRQTFQRLARTYRVFAETCTTGGTRYLDQLSFKHFEVAARLAKDPSAAVTEAYEKDWSANELGRQLVERRGTPPFSLPEAIAKLRAMNVERIASWPEAARPAALEALHQLADDLAARTLAPLTQAEAHAIRWIIADMKDFPFVKHTFIEAGPGRGGDLDVVSGAAGAPIYQTIIGDMTTVGRQSVINAANNLLAGKLTPVGALVLGVARDLAAGKRHVVRTMCLPPDAGGDLTGTLFEATFGDDDLPECLRELIPDRSDPIGLHDEEAVLA